MLVTASAVLVWWRLVQLASSVSVARVWMSAVKLQGTVLYCTVLYCTVPAGHGLVSRAVRVQGGGQGLHVSNCNIRSVSYIYLNTVFNFKCPFIIASY